MTPNLPEAAGLLRHREATNRDEMAIHARDLSGLGPQVTLVKGGHLDGDESPDVLWDGVKLHWFEAARTETKNTHGTGCSLSSAIAAQLAKGLAPSAAIAAAKHYISGAIADANLLTVGQGHGPVHHFYNLWKDKT